jgi:hypothetical protein
VWLREFKIKKKKKGPGWKKERKKETPHLDVFSVPLPYV